MSKDCSEKGWLLPFLNCRPTLVYIMDSCEVYFVMILCAKHERNCKLRNLVMVH